MPKINLFWGYPFFETTETYMEAADGTQTVMKVMICGQRFVACMLSLYLLSTVGATNWTFGINLHIV